jgi:hypothetical protein
MTARALVAHAPALVAEPRLAPTGCRATARTAPPPPRRRAPLALAPPPPPPPAHRRRRAAAAMRPYASAVACSAAAAPDPAATEAVFLAASLASGLCAVSRVSFSVLAPEIQGALGFSLPQMGVLQSALLAGYVLGQVRGWLWWSWWFWSWWLWLWLWFCACSVLDFLCLHVDRLFSASKGGAPRSRCGDARYLARDREPGLMDRAPALP